jgi:hypothetical protein
MKYKEKRYPMEISELEIFPERINVTKVITYDVESVRQQIVADGEEVTLEQVIERIYLYAEDDFGCGWGHKDNLKDLIFQDENGEDY